VIRGLLVDLDNTLITIDVDAFVTGYSQAVARGLVPEDPERGLAVLAGCTYALLSQPEHPETNGQRLVSALTDYLPQSAAALWRYLEESSRSILPELKPLGTPVPGAASLIRRLRRRGLKVAVATNPIYPRTVILERLSWAGLGAEDVDHVACLETCHSVKPYGPYFTGLAEALGLAPEACLMIGDDPDQDLPAREVGMAVHLVAPERRMISDRLRQGPLHDVPLLWADLLPPEAGA
jgi:FMN phosphatase YigB (HAD superfamily)